MLLVLVADALTLFCVMDDLMFSLGRPLGVTGLYGLAVDGDGILLLSPVPDRWFGVAAFEFPAATIARAASTAADRFPFDFDCGRIASFVAAEVDGGFD